MKIKINPVNNQKGSALFIAMIALVSLTLLGIMAISNTMTELKIAGNDRLGKLAFFTTEASRAYVAGHPELYNFNNTDEIMEFPDDADAAKDATKTTSANTVTIGSDQYFCLDGNPPCNQAFRGQVVYLDSEGTKKAPPRGSGFSVGSYSAHRYESTSEGFFKITTDLGSKTKIQQGFYRIGL